LFVCLFVYLFICLFVCLFLFYFFQENLKGISAIWRTKFLTKIMQWCILIFIYSIYIHIYFHFYVFVCSSLYFIDCFVNIMFILFMFVLLTLCLFYSCCLFFIRVSLFYSFVFLFTWMF